MSDAALAPVLKFDVSPNCGALAQGVRPGYGGWYWCKRQGYSSPECVYVLPPYLRAAADQGVVYSVNHGEQPFLASTYNADDVKWFGPIQPPDLRGFW